MSTSFGVLKPGYNILDIEDVSELENKLIEVAYRTNSGNLSWENELAPLLADDIPVFGIDNSNQGINTIGDIKKEIGCTT